MHTHLSGAEPCRSARAVVVLTVWYRLVSHKILLPCFSLLRKKNVVLTFWPTKPKSTKKGQKFQNKVTITTNTGKDHKTLTRKNVALITFWLKNQKLPNLKPKPRTRKGQKSRKKAAILLQSCIALLQFDKKKNVVVLTFWTKNQIQGQNQIQKRTQ